MFKVYKNLHNGKWSIQNKSGVVVGHAEGVQLQNASFKVSEAGRQRVLKQKKKNVHAFVCGEIISVLNFKSFKGRGLNTTLNEKTNNIELYTPIGITYNPYKMGSFYIKENEKPVSSFDYVILKNTVLGYQKFSNQ